MKLVIDIESEGAAATEDPNYTAAAALQVVITKLKNGGDFDVPLRDVNGNAIGRATFFEKGGD